MTNTVVLTIVILTLVGLVLALVLYWVAKKFKVEEDPRIDEVEKVMPGANCGGCGFAGCRNFADAAVKAPNLDSMFCPVGGNEVMKKVAGILGYEVKEKAPQVAVVRCNGSCANRPRTNVYDGVQSCRVKAAASPPFPAPMTTASYLDISYSCIQYNTKTAPSAVFANEKIRLYFS